MDGFRCSYFENFQRLNFRLWKLRFLFIKRIIKYEIFNRFNKKWFNELFNQRLINLKNKWNNELFNQCLIHLKKMDE